MSKIDTSSWKKFKIKDLFDIRKVYGKPLSEYPAGSTPYVTGAQDNNGVIGYVTAPLEAISEGGCISVDPIKGFACWQPDAFVGRGFSGASINLLYNEHLTESTALYVCSCIEKVSTAVAAYTNLFNSNRLADAEISLPVTTAEVPDWDYMQERIAELEQERIAELEQERIAELEQYLVATGLNDYTLTDEDLKTLSLSGFRGNEAGNLSAVAGPRKEMREFRMGTLFTAEKGDVDLQQDDVNGRGCYFINSGLSNDGIKGRTDRPAKTFPANTISIDFWGNAFYRDFEYKMATHNHVFSLSGDIIKNREVGLYLVSQMSKFPTMFSYNNMGTWPKISELNVALPIQTDVNGQPVIDPAKTYHPDGFVPDWEYMAAYIRAIEKLVIKDVVDFKDEFISKARLAVAGKEAV